MRRGDSRRRFCESTHAAGVDSRIIDPFAGAPGERVGLFGIVLTGPSGSSLHHTVYLLEGVEITHGQWVRVPVAGGGLDAVEATISSRGAVQPVATTVTFSSDEPTKPVEFTADGITQRWILTPPYARVHIGGEGQAVR